MENKCYTPAITECHVGFELEYSDNSKEWTYHTIKEGEVLRFLGNREYRVKYLDQEDIESLGFEFDERTEENVDIYYNKSKEFMFGFCNDFFNRNIVFIRKRRVGSEYIDMFYGKIKNKSELKKVLKQIGYEE